ncbi:MAG: flagellar protein FlaG [Gallionellaceae bacterium]|nr:MAG: flagellar protein FlaG [Gallionellaceae bacterium]
MLIQNVNSALPTPQPVRLPSDGAPKVVEAVEAVEATVQALPQQPSAQQLKNAVSHINQALQKANMSMELSVDSSTKKPVVKMMDAETGELIRQFPSEEVLAIASSIDQFLEFQQGMLLKTKA